MKKKAITFPKFPIIEISEQAPVVLFNGRVYSIKDEEEMNYGENKFNGAPLIEIGSFEELDELFLERNQKVLNDFKEDYKKEIEKKVISTANKLDLSQLIYSQLFPILRGEEYQNKIDTFLGLEKEETPVLQKIDKKGLEKSVLNIEDKLKKEREKIKPIKEESLIKTIFGEENQIILNNKSYLVSKKGKNYFQKLSLEGEVFYISEKTPNIAPLKEGTIISINALARKDGLREIYAGNKGKIVKNLGDGNYQVTFKPGTRGDNYYSLVLTINLNEKYFKETNNSGEPNFLSIKEATNKRLEERLKLEVLEKEFTREKIIEEISKQNLELLRFKDKKEYEEGNFGFVDDYNPFASLNPVKIVYEKISPFLVEYPPGYYLYENPRVGIRVYSENISKQRLGPSEELFLINGTSIKRLCMGQNDLPFFANNSEDLIAKRLKKAKDMVFGGFSKDWLNISSYIGSKISKKYSGLPIINALTGKRKIDTYPQSP